MGAVDNIAWMRKRAEREQKEGRTSIQISFHSFAVRAWREWALSDLSCYSEELRGCGYVIRFRKVSG